MGGAAVSVSPVWNGDRYTSKIFEGNKQKSPNPKQSSCFGFFFCLSQRLCHLVTSSLLISLVDGILEGKGRSGGSMQELIPPILNANTSLIQEKKDTGRFSAESKQTNTESMPQMVIGCLWYGGKPTLMNSRFQSCRKHCLQTCEIV